MIAQRFAGSGEVRIALRINSSKPAAFVTGDAIERDQSLVDLLPIIESQSFRPRQSLRD